MAQVRLRAERLGLGAAPVELASETNVEDIVATLSQGRPPALAIIDSIQTMWTETVESAPGTVTQVRGSAQALIRFAKTTRHLGDPRRPRHQGRADRRSRAWSSTWSTRSSPSRATRGHHFRILRAVKNRFGPTDEIGVFEMSDRGLREVPNPSALFLAGRDLATPGTAVFAGMEGTRPVLVEIQALVAPTSLGTPRRAVVGWDPNRLSMVLAVLEAHGGLRLGMHDVYLNVAGGLRITEPAADLAAAAALVSSLSGSPLPPDTVYFGELGLSGRDPAGRAGAGAAQGGGEARLRPGRRRRPAPSRTERPPLATAAVAHIADLVAGVAGERPGRRGAIVRGGRNRSPSRRPARSPCSGARRRKGDAGRSRRYTAAAPVLCSLRAQAPCPFRSSISSSSASSSSRPCSRPCAASPARRLSITAWARGDRGRLVPAPAGAPLRQAVHRQATRSRSSRRSARIFMVTLIVVSIITVKISDLILDSRIGALDRTLGFLFGAARGFLICVIGWVMLGWLLQGKNPAWAEAARTRPALESTGESLRNRSSRCSRTPKS